MSAHSHDNHHSAEQKPVAFSVPFYLAAATLVFLFFFLSLCDPKAHHEGGHDEHQATEAAAGHGEATHQEHGAAAEAPEAVTTDEHTAEPAKMDSAAAAMPAAEPAAAEHH